MVEILSRDPTPHRTRRIRRKGSGQFDMGCGAWRVRFEVQDSSVTILWIDTGYPPRSLKDEQMADVPDREAQRAFLKRWPLAPDAGDESEQGEDSEGSGS